MSVGAFIQADRQERLDAARARRMMGQEQMLAARTLIRRRFPEFIIDRAGYRCYDAVAINAVLDLWAEHGQGNVTVRQLRARYDELVEQRKEAS